MKSKVFLVLFVVLVLMITGSAAVAATDVSKAPINAGAVVPFRAHYQTFPVETGFDPDTSIITFEIPGEGKATHLGKSTLYSDSWVDVSQPLPFPGWGIMTFTAANGDQLFGTYDGTHVYGSFEGSFQITGGNGRFEGVVGAGDYWGTVENDLGSITYIGTLSK